MQRHSFPPCPRPSPPGSCDYEPKSPRKYEIRKHLLTRHLKTEAEADALLLNLAPVARGEGATAADDDGDQDDSDNDAECEVCASAADAASMLLCDGCDDGYHMACLRPRLTALPAGDWFDAATHPKAVFTATRFEKKAEGAFVAHGTLQLRGVTKPVDLPFKLKIVGDKAQMSGEASLDRIVFGVGQGEFTSTEQVPAKVAVRVQVNAISDKR